MTLDPNTWRLALTKRELGPLKTEGNTPVMHRGDRLRLELAVYNNGALVDNWSDVESVMVEMTDATAQTNVLPVKIITARNAALTEEQWANGTGQHVAVDYTSAETLFVPVLAATQSVRLLLTISAAMVSGGRVMLGQGYIVAKSGAGNAASAPTNPARWYTQSEVDALIAGVGGVPATGGMFTGPIHTPTVPEPGPNVVVNMEMLGLYGLPALPVDNDNLALVTNDSGTTFWDARWRVANGSAGYTLKGLPDSEPVEVHVVFPAAATAVDIGGQLTINLASATALDALALTVDNVATDLDMLMAEMPVTYLAISPGTVTGQVPRYSTATATWQPSLDLLQGTMRINGATMGSTQPVALVAPSTATLPAWVAGGTLLGIAPPASFSGYALDVYSDSSVAHTTFSGQGEIYLRWGAEPRVGITNGGVHIPVYGGMTFSSINNCNGTRDLTVHRMAARVMRLSRNGDATATNTVDGAALNLPPMPGASATSLSGWSLFCDSSDGNKLKARHSGGTVVTIATP